MTEPEPPAEDAPAGPAAVIGILTAEADLTVTPAPEPAEEDGDG